MTEYRAQARVTFESSRPSQLLLVGGVYLLGAKIAGASGATLSARTVVLGALPLLFVSASIHYANEYADYETDALTDRTPFSGGSGAPVETGVARSFVGRLAAGSLAVGAVVTVAVVAAGVLDGPALAVLVVATLFGWQYSVGPLKLAWRGWGELTNAALGGLEGAGRVTACRHGSRGRHADLSLGEPRRCKDRSERVADRSGGERSEP